LQRVKDLLFDPNLTISPTGASLNNGSTNVTGLTVPTGKVIRVGQTIMGTGIPNGTTIAAIISATQITLSQVATQTNIGQTLTVVDQPTGFDSVLVRLINLRRFCSSLLSLISSRAAAWYVSRMCCSDCICHVPFSSIRRPCGTCPLRVQVTSTDGRG
jgi:hypothetical protein